jgi:hypothetical protein
MTKNNSIYPQKSRKSLVYLMFPEDLLEGAAEMLAEKDDIYNAPGGNL